jgi:hypothetical protein
VGLVRSGDFRDVDPFVDSVAHDISGWDNAADLEDSLARTADLSAVDVAGAMNAMEPARQAWRAEIAQLGGPSPLLFFSDTPRTRLDLTTTHPGGLPKFLAGEPTRLTHLYREEFTLRNARIAAAALESLASSLRVMRGIETVFLAVGVASWNFGGTAYSAPVMLRPMAVRRLGQDFELVLRGGPVVNPRLVQALEDQFHISLDTRALVGLAQANDTFAPQPVIERLTGLTGHVPGFSIENRLVCSSFGDVATRMGEDARELVHPVLDALAGNASARDRLVSSLVTPDPASQDTRPPSSDTLILDADAEQEEVVAHITAGNSVVVKALPGTGRTQTVVNALGALTSAGKRVLVVTPRRASADAIRQRIDQAGLGGLCASPRTLRKDLIAGILRNERAARPDVTEVDDALTRLRKVLLNYRDALGKHDAVLGVSVLDALQELSRLALLPEPPATTARLPRRAVEALAFDRSAATAMLISAAELGQFRYGPDDSPWYGVTFANNAESQASHDLAKRIHTIDLPRLLERAHEVVGQTRMRSFENLIELGLYIRLLGDTLDTFVPNVFDRPLDDVIAATASRRGHDMPPAARKNLRKLANEFVRPGASVSDMHTSLVRIQEQRVLWQRYTVAGALPEVPVGVSDLSAAYQRVMDDMAALDAPLQAAGATAPLNTLPIGELTNTISALAADSEVLANLQERMTLIDRLRELNLETLLEDLSMRHVPTERVAEEFELAWWQSVLEGMLDGEQALLGTNTGILDRLESDFRMVDEAHAGANSALLAAKLAELWKIGLVDYPEESDRLRHALKSGHITVGELFEIAPRLARAISPVWVVSPYEAHVLPVNDFDVTMILDAGATTVAENVCAIKRGKQVVAFGDPIVETPGRFTTNMADDESGDLGESLDELHGASAMAQLSEIVPVFSLTRSYRTSGSDLTSIINRRFYAGRINYLPWAGSFLGSKSVRLHVVADGMGAPDPNSGTIEATHAEVSRVTEMVLEHASTRSRESLMVVSPSRKTAALIQASVTSAIARRDELVNFLLADNAEPFTVRTLAESAGLTRDRVIFATGYGLTPHGRLLNDFGPLSLLGGERLLAVGLTRARRNLDVVSCFGPQHLDGATLEHGARLPADIVREVHAPVREKGTESTTEPMLRDLAERLRQRGLAVELSYGGDISLVASHGRVAVAVETDAVLSRGTLRESLRLRPAALRRLGWHYVRVHTFELFADPEAVAARIAGIAGLSSAVTMEVETLQTASRVEPVETHAPQSATEAIDAAIESVTPIVAAPSYVARFADEEPLAAPLPALSVEQNQDEVLTAPLDVPELDVPELDVPVLDVPVLDVPQSQAPRQDAPPKRASDDIPRADALDDE